MVAALAIPQAEGWKRHSSGARNRHRGVRAPALRITAESRCGKGKVEPHTRGDGSRDMDACAWHVIT